MSKLGKIKGMENILDQLAEMSSGIVSFTINGRTYSVDENDPSKINVSEGFKKVDFDAEKFCIDWRCFVCKIGMESYFVDL